MKRRRLVAAAAAVGPAACLVAAPRLGAQAALPVAAPVIGVLGGSTRPSRAVAFILEGLAHGGFEVGRNLTIEYRWADNRPERLPALVAELLRIPVALIVAISGAPTRAAQAATSSVPVVFEVGADPVAAGLVASLARPGGNLTGVHLFTADLNAKRLGLLREMLPRARTVAILLNPTLPGAQRIEADMSHAAAQIGLAPVFVRAATESEFEAAFARFKDQRAGALIVGNDPFFTARPPTRSASRSHHRCCCAPTR